MAVLINLIQTDDGERFETKQQAIRHIEDLIASVYSGLIIPIQTKGFTPTLLHLADNLEDLQLITKLFTERDQLEKGKY